MSAHQFREDGSHYNGGSAFFGYGYQAIGEPRLHMVRKWYRQGVRRGQTEDSFSVDGAPVASYEAALAALKTPPVLTDDERPVLAMFSGDAIRFPKDHWEQAYALRHKGFIVCEGGQCMITDAGAEALQKLPTEERSDGH